MFPILLKANPLAGYQLWLEYDDGTTGVVDLAYLSGKGIFKLWEKEGFFEAVQIDAETNALVWNDQLDLDPDSLYLKIKGTSFDTFIAQQSASRSHATN